MEKRQDFLHLHLFLHLNTLLPDKHFQDLAEYIILLSISLNIYIAVHH